MRKRIATAILVSVLIIGSLSGCGKAERDDIADSLYDLQDTASRTDGDEATAGGGIPEHLSYSVKTDDGTSINVEADVISSGFQNTQVYEAEVIEIDEDLIKKYADNLFDESK